MTNPTDHTCNPYSARATPPSQSRAPRVGMSARPARSRLANPAPLLGVATSILLLTADRLAQRHTRHHSRILALAGPDRERRPPMRSALRTAQNDGPPTRR